MTLTADATAGSTVIQVDSYACGLVVGSTIVIGGETHVVAGFGSIILATPLQQNHAAGTTMGCQHAGCDDPSPPSPPPSSPPFSPPPSLPPPSPPTSPPPSAPPPKPDKPPPSPPPAGSWGWYLATSSSQSCNDVCAAYVLTCDSTALAFTGENRGNYEELKSAALAAGITCNTFDSVDGDVGPLIDGGGNCLQTEDPTNQQCEGTRGSDQRICPCASAVGDLGSGYEDVPPPSAPPLLAAIGSGLGVSSGLNREGSQTSSIPMWVWGLLAALLGTLILLGLAAWGIKRAYLAKEPTEDTTEPPPPQPYGTPTKPQSTPPRWTPSRAVHPVNDDQYPPPMYTPERGSAYANSYGSPYIDPMNTPGLYQNDQPLPPIVPMHDGPPSGAYYDRPAYTDPPPSGAWYQQAASPYAQQYQHLENQMQSPPAVQDAFAAADTNGDGVLDQSEFSKFIKSVGPRTGAVADALGGECVQQMPSVQGSPYGMRAQDPQYASNYACPTGEVALGASSSNEGLLASSSNEQLLPSSSSSQLMLVPAGAVTTTPHRERSPQRRSPQRGSPTRQRPTPGSGNNPRVAPM